MDKTKNTFLKLGIRGAIPNEKANGGV